MQKENSNLVLPERQGVLVAYGSQLWIKCRSTQGETTSMKNTLIIKSSCWDPSVLYSITTFYSKSSRFLASKPPHWLLVYRAREHGRSETK